MKPRELGIGISLSLISLVLLIGILEVALRYVVLPPLNPFEPDREIGFRLKAGFDGVYPRAPVRTDPDRHRIPMDASSPPTGEILFVGDSVTFGFGVRAEETYVQRLGDLLGRPSAVTNAAVPAYNLLQVVETLERNLERVRPEIVIYGAVINDVRDATNSLEDAYRGIDPHAGRAGTLAGYSLVYALIERRWQRLMASWDDPADSEESRGDSTSDGTIIERIHPDAVAAYRDQWRDLEQVQQRVSLPVYVLILPYRAQLEASLPRTAWQEFAKQLCDGGPLLCLDPYDSMREHVDESLFNGRSDTHFNPRGHELLAEWLARHLPPAAGGRPTDAAP